MSAQLGPPLIHLFAPRPPIRYLAPADNAPEKRTTTAISGIGAFVSLFGQHDQDYQGTETLEEAKRRQREEKKANHEKALKQAAEGYNPNEDTQVRGDPYKTLFVSRLAYDVTEDDLQREFGRYGAIERIRIVHSTKDQKPRGYAFLVFERERDMRAAYKDTNDIKIKDRRICVDVERGRTVKNWKPMRLGGGLGGRRKPAKMPAVASYSNHNGSGRSHQDRAPQTYGRSHGYDARDDRPRDRNSSRTDRPPDSYDRHDRYERNDRAYAAPPPRAHAPIPPPSGDRARHNGRQGIGFDRAPDPRASSSSRPYQDSHISFTPSSAQPPLDPRARQPPTTYASTVPSAPSAPWLASGPSSSGSRRDRPSHDDERDRDSKRRRY